MIAPAFKPGFRFSIRDAVFAIFVACIVAYVYQSNEYIAYMIATGLLQFFLFCNVFRIRRKLELTWASIFLGISFLGFSLDYSPFIAATISLAIGAILILIGMRHPGYHGVMWNRCNPDLRQWFQENIAQQGDSEGTPPCGAPDL